MIRLDNISNDYFSLVSFEIKAGSICKIITNSDHERRVMLDTMLSFNKPAQGKVFLLGKDIYDAGEHESSEIFKKIGVIWRYGGLLSNLTVWDNIVLPVLYHTDYVPDEVEKRVVDIFGQFGIGGDRYLADYFSKPCGLLPIHEKRLIGMVRSILIDPALIIYDSMFEGFDREMLSRLLPLTERLHAEKPDTTFVFLESEEISNRDVKADMLLKQQGRQFIRYEE